MIYSCNKEENIPQSNLSENENVESKIIIDKSNVNDFVNPYEFVGEIHNKALTEIIKYDKINLAIIESFNIIKNIVKFEFQKIGYEAEIDFFLTQEKINYFENYPSIDQGWNDFLLTLPHNQRSIFNNFENEINKFKTHDNYGISISNIKKFEKQAFENNSYSENDKILLLSALAIGRNSFSFWRDQDIINGDDYYELISPWRADISGFVDGWNSNVGDNGSLGDRIQYACDMGSIASETARQ